MKLSTDVSSLQSLVISLSNQVVSLSEQVKVLTITVSALTEENALLKQENELLKKENASLKLENAELRSRLDSNSKNSHLPPSKDLFKSKPAFPKSGTGKQGGKEGHKGHTFGLWAGFFKKACNYLGIALYV